MSTFASLPFLHALGWALCHSLWQGAAIGLLAKLCLHTARHRAPEFRYRLAAGALALVVLAFAGTLVWLLPRGGDGLPAEGFLVAPIPESGGAGWWGRLRLLATPWLPWLTLAWGTGLGLRLLKVGGGLAWLYGPCLGAADPAPPEWQGRVDRLRREAGIRPPVRLRLSWEVDSLLVLGWLKPVILLPAGALLVLPPESLEALLVHELAHIRRGDFLANLVQTLAESILFYHPAVWWLSRRIRQERELCCDDAAVQACGDPILYASALLALEELRIPPTSTSDLAPAARGGHLMSRIQRLLRPRSTDSVATPADFLLPTALVAAALATTVLSASAAGTPPPPTRAAEASAPVDLDLKQVRIRRQPEAPAYPPEAKAQRIQGTVVVVVTIGPDGKVTDALAESGPEELRACAVAYARGWEFEPVKVKGKPVAARFKLTMPFRLR